MPGRTLYDKLWDSHLVTQRDDGSALIYIDRHLLHEVTSPQAFEGLALAERKPWRLSANLATVDHNVPTENQSAGVSAIEDQRAVYKLKHLTRTAIRSMSPNSRWVTRERASCT